LILFLKYQLELWMDRLFDF